MNRVKQSCDGELALLDPAIRSNEQAVNALLHPEFAERGQSGSWWTRESTLTAMAREADSGEKIEVRDLVGVELAPRVVLVTYVTVRETAATGRSSIWIEHDGRMRIRWHQGTPLPQAP
jgi:hypothetical protein